MIKLEKRFWPIDGSTVDRYRVEIETQGYSVLKTADLVSNPAFLKAAQSEFFTKLEVDRPDVHADRMRARDVFNYRRHDDDSVSLAEADSVSLVNRNYAGSREYNRVPMLANDEIGLLAASLIGLVPKAHQRREGTFGLNCFRTHRVVTQTRHQDGEEFVAIVCLDVNGRAAQTELSTDSAGKDLLARFELSSGQILMFDDRRMWHYTSDLEPIDGNPYRDVLVVTVNNPA